MKTRGFIKGVEGILITALLFTCGLGYAKTVSNPMGIEDAGFSANPTTVPQGGMITITQNISNTGDLPVQHIYPDPLLVKYGLGYWEHYYTSHMECDNCPLTLRAGETETMNISYYMPTFVKPGDYQFSVTVYAGTTYVICNVVNVTVMDAGGENLSLTFQKPTINASYNQGDTIKANFNLNNTGTMSLNISECVVSISDKSARPCRPVYMHIVDSCSLNISDSLGPGETLNVNCSHYIGTKEGNSVLQIDLMYPKSKGKEYIIYTDIFYTVDTPSYCFYYVTPKDIYVTPGAPLEVVYDIERDRDGGSYDLHYVLEIDGVVEDTWNTGKDALGRQSHNVTGYSLSDALGTTKHSINLSVYQDSESEWNFFDSLTSWFYVPRILQPADKVYWPIGDTFISDTDSVDVHVRNLAVGNLNYELSIVSGNASNVWLDLDDDGTAETQGSMLPAPLADLPPKDPPDTSKTILTEFSEPGSYTFLAKATEDLLATAFDERNLRETLTICMNSIMVGADFTAGDNPINPATASLFIDGINVTADSERTENYIRFVMTPNTNPAYVSKKTYDCVARVNDTVGMGDVYSWSFTIK